MRPLSPREQRRAVIQHAVVAGHQQAAAEPAPVILQVSTLVDLIAALNRAVTGSRRVRELLEQEERHMDEISDRLLKLSRVMGA